MLGNYYHTIGQDGRGEPLLRSALSSIQESSDADLRRDLTCLHAMSLAGFGRVKEAEDALNAVIADPRINSQQSASVPAVPGVHPARTAVIRRTRCKYANRALEKLHQVKHPLLSQEGSVPGQHRFRPPVEWRERCGGKYFSQSLAQYARVGRDRSPDAISVRNNWAIVSMGAGEPRKALELYDQTLQIVTQKDPGARPPQYLLGNRARALEALGTLQRRPRGLFKVHAGGRPGSG